MAQALHIEDLRQEMYDRIPLRVKLLMIIWSLLFIIMSVAMYLKQDPPKNDYVVNPDTIILCAQCVALIILGCAIIFICWLLTQLPYYYSEAYAERLKLLKSD